MGCPGGSLFSCWQVKKMKTVFGLRRAFQAVHNMFPSVLFIALTLSFIILNGCRSSVHVDAELVSEVRSIQPGRAFCVALRLQMDEHWHTYWKNPGDSGMPTKIVWHLPDGFSAGEVQWPCPQKFGKPPVVSFGYADEVFLVTEVKADENVKPRTEVKISATAEWLACKESCIPGTEELSLILPVKNSVPDLDTRWAGRFVETRKNIPRAFPDWKIRASAGGRDIFIQVDPPPWFKDELTGLTFFPEQEGLIDYSKTQILKKSRTGYVLEVRRTVLSTSLPQRLHGVLFSSKGWSQAGQERAFYIDLPLHQQE